MTSQISIANYHLPTILLIDNGIEIYNQLSESVSNQDFVVRHATSSENLVEETRLLMPELIIINDDGSSIIGLEICKSIRNSYHISRLPIIVITGEQIDDRCEYYKAGVDEHIFRPYEERTLVQKIRIYLERIQHYVNASPLTGLPGNPVVEKEIRRRMQGGEKMAVAYLDIDYFKSYNDTYGWLEGDKVIHETADIILEVTEQHCGSDSFVAHLGGDDFVVILPPELAETFCQHLIKEFDRRVRSVYNEQDRKREYIIGKDRLGNLYCFPLMTISIAVCTNRKRQLEHPGQVAQISLELKEKIKSKLGSNYIIDRGGF